MTKRDLTGQRFGRLVVRGRAPSRNTYRDAYWLCQCDCGGNKESSTPPAAACECQTAVDAVSKGVTPRLCVRACAINTINGRTTAMAIPPTDHGQNCLCNIEGCNAKAVSKGLCAKHYQRALRHRRREPILRPHETCEPVSCLVLRGRLSPRAVRPSQLLPVHLPRGRALRHRRSAVRDLTLFPHSGEHAAPPIVVGCARTSPLPVCA
jgi:hypothetical protein